MKKKILLIFCIIFLFLALYLLFQKEATFNNQCEFNVYRFEQDFFTINPDSFDVEFPQIKAKYSNFFSDTTVNFKNDVFLNDTLNVIFDSVQVFFKDSLLYLDEIQKGFCNFLSNIDSFFKSKFTF